jgi:hypothetical protein
MNRFNMKTTEINKGDTFSIAGEEYAIVDNLLQFACRGVARNAPTTVGEMQKFGEMRYYTISENRYVLYSVRRYPCFDSYDYAHENRCFRAFYLCHSREEMQRKYDILASGKLFFSNENPTEEYRAPLAPYVYVDDDRNTFGVYE